VEFLALGPLEVRHQQRCLPLGTPKQRTVLALLLMNVGQRVSVDELVDEVWEDDPPASAVPNIRTYAANLRRILASAAGDAAPLGRRAGGYVLAIERPDFDVLRFDGISLAAREAAHHEKYAAVAELWREARGQWRARETDVCLGPRLRGWWQALVGERLDAVDRGAEALIRDGRGGEAITLLRGHVAQEPLRERSQLLLARALYGAGDVVAALATFTATRTHLIEALGVEPGEEFQRLYTAMLRREPDPFDLAGASVPVHAPSARVGLATASDSGRSPAQLSIDVSAAATDDVGTQTRKVHTRPAPAQLPADVAGFVGRAEHLARLDMLVTTAGTEASTAVVIAAVSGTAGVGKTALAVRWAHRVRARFPDGQLYVNLRGFEVGGRLMKPGEAIRGFLDALGVPPERIPTTLDAQAGLYRSLLSGKQILVVLDNARDAEQVRPLLPGTPTAVAVVTSRNQLTSLVAADCASLLTLDLLSTVEAQELIAQRLGTDRVAAEPRSVEQIIAACARLPLALSIAVARAQQTRFPLATLAAELGQAGERLAALDAGDSASNVRAVFSWSYTALRAPAARLFRLVGLHPGPDISTAAAASLTGQAVHETRQLLTELVRANLLVEHVPGRYSFHDLLRAYAVDLTHTHDPDHARQTATNRLLDHFTHTAYSADRLLHPVRDPIELPLAPVPSDANSEHLADHQQAMAWLTTEHPVLLAAIWQAFDTGRDSHTWQLAWTLHTFLYRRGHWLDLAAVWQAALTAAQRLRHPGAQVAAHRFLGRADIGLGRFTDAQIQLQRALDLYTQAGDLPGQARTHISLANLWERQGRTGQALDHSQQALTLYQAASHSGQANALNSVGWFHSRLGNHAQALTYCEQALLLLQQTGNRAGQANTCDSLGYAHHHLGHHTQAADFFQHALTLLRDLGDRYTEASVLTRLGDNYHAAGNGAAARDIWQQALTICTDLDHPDAPGVRTKLADLDTSTDPFPATGL
jgi:DNA-binding SARP family transcriptional activator/tetratricopeptide (TPR) repeat protein